MRAAEKVAQGFLTISHKRLGILSESADWQRPLKTFSSFLSGFPNIQTGRFHSIAGSSARKITEFLEISPVVRETRIKKLFQYTANDEVVADPQDFVASAACFNIILYRGVLSMDQISIAEIYSWASND